MKKYEVVYNKFRDDILNGYLKKGSQLPSIRESCELFKLSQTTIEHAYEKLVIDGYIVSLPNIGYYVSIEEERIELHKEFDEYSIENKKINYLYDFRSQTVSMDNFEVNTWKRYLKDVLDNENDMSTYGDSQGEYVLREALCQYAYKNRGVISKPNHILVGSNYQSLLFILCSLLEKDKVIGMENNQSVQALRVFHSYGFKVEFINNIDEGIDIEDLKKHHIDYLYINSASTGKYKKKISNTLRNQLLQYTSNNNIIIIEDDYNGELTYASKDQHAMQGFSKNDNVIYCGSFSRLLLPSLRISYMVLNNRYYELYKKHKVEYGPTASKLEQLAFSKYIADGYLQKHLKKLKKEYKEKNIIMNNMLKKYISYSYYLNEAYLSYIIYLENIDEEKFIQLCKENNIAINNIINHQLSISFASLNIKQIEDAIILLNKLIKQSKE